MTHSLNDDDAFAGHNVNCGCCDHHWTDRRETIGAPLAHPHDLGPACVPHGKGPLRLHSPDSKSIDAAGLFFVFFT